MGTLDHAFFYNSENGDRLYDADSFSEWLKKFFTTGVFTGDYQVVESDGMQVKVQGGYCNIGGKVKMTAQDTPLDVTVAHARYDRIDTVVMERNDTERDFNLKVITGSATDTPQPTAPVREGAIYQLVLAHIRVKAGATAISQADITDTRLDKALCGLVCATVTEINFTQIQKQFDAFLRDYKQDVEETYASYEEDITRFEQLAQQDFTVWFESIKDQLSTDAAGNLQLEIDKANLQMFKNLYGLCTKTTNISKDDAGVTIQIAESDTEQNVNALTVFERDGSGNTTKITTTVTPGVGAFKYVKQTIFTQVGVNKTIAESYTRESK